MKINIQPEWVLSKAHLEEGYEIGAGAERELIQKVKSHLRSLSDDERVEFFSEILSEYCRYCGCGDAELLNHRSCPCTNDE